MFEKPLSGSRVKVTTRYLHRQHNSNNDYADFTSEGTVIDSPKWLQPTEFAIANPKQKYGFSVINLNKVIDLQYADGKQASIKLPSQDYKEWTVTGSKGNSYLVVRTKNVYSCTCPGFTYRKHCRHIEEASHE